MSKGKRTPLVQGILSSDIYGLGFRENRTPSPDLQIQNEEDEGTPRKTTPVKTSAISRPNCGDELSLSDNEAAENKSTKTKGRAAFTSEVVVVETSGDDLTTSGEVPTRSFTIESPVKVIRHSPSPSFDDSKEVKFKTSKSDTGHSFDETKHQDITDSSHGDSKKKKKKYVPVQSRYKQVAANKKEEPRSRNASLELSAITPHPNAQQTTKTSQTKSTRTTSTPFLQTSMYERQLPADGGSILDQSRFQTNEPQIKKPLMKKTKLKKDKDTKRKEMSTKDTSSETKTGNSPDNEQLVIDLHYARLMQISYLRMKAQQTFEKQEEKAKKELYGLWALNRKLEKEIDAMKLSLETRKLEIQVDQILKHQMDGFKPLNDKLSKLIAKLSRVSATLSNTFHHIPINNVTLPNEDNLIKSLDESKRLLAEVNSFIRSEGPKIEALTTASEVLSKTIQSELVENERCSTTLKSCNRLLNQERSLQAHLLEVT